MYSDNEKVVLCGASAYEQKYYFNQDFASLPQSVQDELHVMCVMFTVEIGGIFTMWFDSDGSLQFETEAVDADAMYDEIGGALRIKQYQEEKKELLESLELYYRVFFLGEEVPEEALMEARLARILRGRRKALSGTTVVQIGDTAHGFTNLYCDQEALARNLGVAVRRCSLEDIFARMRQVDSGAAAALARTLPEGAVCCAASGMELELTARLILAVRQLKKEWNADAFAISCWPEFQQDLHVSTCYAFALLNQEGIPVSCEGDLPGALTMHLAKMAGGEAPMLMDLVAMDQSADAISFWHCGMGMPCHADAGGYALGKYPADPRVLDLPGISVDEKFAPGPVTICRLSGPWAQTLFVCQAQIVPGPDRGYDGARGWFSEFTMGGRPLRAAEFFDAVCQNGIPHHYVICRGHVEQALREMAACSRMETAALPVGWYSEVKECGR